jgi:endonuclease/exonuclease/phosphatase family metal-dependent hydrolase
MKKIFSIFITVYICFSNLCFSQNDTLSVMTYNVLHYGDGCQGSNGYLHSKLKTIVKYANPDILGLVKMQAIKINATDWNGISPVGFADSVIAYALNVAYPGKYAYCTLTNLSNDVDGDMDVLFYNQNKLGFVSVVNLCKNQEDFDLYKLHYKDPNLTTTNDTTFLYVILNHTISGTTTAGRDQQDSTVVKGLQNSFYHLPNVISMGDFNTHTSAEPGYELYTTTSDTSFIFYDPPFKPDHNLNYPLNWNSNSSCSKYLNTTTRQSSSVPNSCGTNGGAKDWFIHIFLSKWLVSNFDYINYIPNSYTTIGNDGKRFSISVNDSTTNGKNLSAPPNVLNALFDLSDKYPIMVKLGVTFNTTNAIKKINSNEDIAVYPNPCKAVFTIENNATIKQTVYIYNLNGELVLHQTMHNKINSIDVTNLQEGIYNISILEDKFLVNKKLVIIK